MLPRKSERLFLNVIEGGEKGAKAKCGSSQYQLRVGLYQSGRDLELETMDEGGKHEPGPRAAAT